MNAPRTTIAVVPNPGTGHLIPLAEFARHLLRHNPSLFFTFILIPSNATEAASPVTPSSLTAVLPTAAFNVVHLPLPSFPAFTEISDEMFSRVLNSINNSLEPLRKTLQDLTLEKNRVSALIVDIFSTEVISIGSEIGVKSFLFHSSSAMALSVSFHFPEDTTSWSSDKPLTFPGCPVIQVKDLPDPVQDPTKPYFKWFVDHCKRFSSADAIVLNSFHALEEETIRALTIEKPVYVVGPLVRKGDDVDRNDVKDPSGCLKWLDGQPSESVLYVSFGSGGTLSTEQVTELAWGLEMSQQRFVWVVRSPNDSISFGTYLSLEEKADPLGFLPSGFVERTKERGLVVLSWAPQVEILGHMSTGGFMTHCGWNSVLEGVASGVGFITWPLYAEQRMNAVELVKMVKIGVEVEKDKNGIVRRDEIVKAVKELMEGEEGKKIKERMKTLKEEAKTTMEQDGLSNVTLSKLAHMLN